MNIIDANDSTYSDDLDDEDYKFSLTQKEMFEIFYGSDKDYQERRELEGWTLFEATATLIGTDGKEHLAIICGEMRLFDKEGNGEMINLCVAKWLDENDESDTNISDRRLPK